MDSFTPTTKTQQALSAAVQAAASAGNPDVRPAHILVALLDQSDGIASPLLKAVGVDPSNVRAQARCWSTACRRLRRPVPPPHNSPANRSRRSARLSSWPVNSATSTSRPSTSSSVWRPVTPMSPSCCTTPEQPPPGTAGCVRRSPREPTRHERGPGVDLPGAREVLDRPDGSRP